jgi:hypothetical protein
MRVNLQPRIIELAPGLASPPLELVIPVTTPELTRAGLKAAEWLAADISARIRLIRIQVVPFPLELTTPPVPLEFVQKQMEAYSSTLPLNREVRVARDYEPALFGALRAGSIVVVAARKRPWRTRNERLAARLRRAGFTTILTWQGEANA